MEQMLPVEQFVEKAILSQHPPQDSNSSPSPELLEQKRRAYESIIDLLRNRRYNNTTTNNGKDDSRLIHRILLAMRSAGNGSSLGHIASTSNKHARLLHFIFKFNPFLMTPTKQQQQQKQNSNDDDDNCWSDYSIAIAHLNLIVALVSANSVLVHPAISALWKMLVSSTEETTEDLRRSIMVHSAMATILRICPKAESHIFPLMKTHFPFKYTPSSKQLAYANHCIAVLRYLPSLHSNLLGLLVDRSLDIDVEIKIEQGGNVSLDKQQQAPRSSDNDDVVMDMDMTHDNNIDDVVKKEADEVVPETPKVNNGESSHDNDDVNEMADKLDSLMNLIFHHLITSSKSLPTSPIYQSPQSLYEMLLPTFDSTILPTHRSKFVQFIMFLICAIDNTHNNNNTNDGSTTSNRLYRSFATRLLNIILDPYRATVLRQSSACYLASFISRAQYVCDETVCEVIAALLRWSEAYMNIYSKTTTTTTTTESVSCGDNSGVGGGLEQNHRDKCEVHSLFYTVCQAAFYIMCFRCREAISYYRKTISYHNHHHHNDNHDTTSTTTMMMMDQQTEKESHHVKLDHIDISPTRWEKLCSNPLNPLRYCLESVRIEFLHLSNVFQLLQPLTLQRLLYEMNEKRNDGSSSNSTTPLEEPPMTQQKQQQDQGMDWLLSLSSPLKISMKKRRKSFSSSSIIRTPVTAEKARRKSLISSSSSNGKKKRGGSSDSDSGSGGVGGMGRGSNPLDSFFPFDPYLLRRSYDYIAPYYRSWDGGVEADDDDDDDDLQTAAKNDNDDDEEEEIEEEIMEDDASINNNNNNNNDDDEYDDKPFDNDDDDDDSEMNENAHWQQNNIPDDENINMEVMTSDLSSVLVKPVGNDINALVEQNDDDDNKQKILNLDTITTMKRVRSQSIGNEWW